MCRLWRTRSKAIIFTTLLALSVLAASCSKSEQPATNSSASSPSTAASAGEFEGVIAMKMETVDETTAEMTYYLKGKNTRIETKIPNRPEGPAVMLFDPDAGKIVTLMPSQKMYFTMDMKATAEDMKKMKKAHGQEDPEFPKLTATGKTETIAGYTCELSQSRSDVRDLSSPRNPVAVRPLGLGGRGGVRHTCPSARRRGVATQVPG